MGIYLGQLPPAEIARLKAELAETLIANFCYPRFFDCRTESLRMRPVDRAKRQEVWLYLSSFDFTAWSRVDLMSQDFHYYIERLFIQFVQRNRSFFGEQGRKRMSDIRMLIGSSSSAVVQGLRNHLAGQKQGGQLFGSPRPTVSWSSTHTHRKSDLSWEQISASTMLLQQQVQEWRGEIKPVTQSDGRSGNAYGPAPRSPRPAVPVSPTAQAESAALSAGNGRSAVVPPTVTPPAAPAARGIAASAPNVAAPPVTPLRARKVEAPNPAASTVQPDLLVTPRKVDALVPTPATLTEPPIIARKAEVLVSPPITPSGVATARTSGANGTAPLPETASPPVSSVPGQARALPQPAQPTPPLQSSHSITTSQRSVGHVGEDDIAIFEQMRHQLLIWLRVEAVRAGLEIANQGPAQLLEMLRQQAHFDETRLQVVSTLLNLSTQVIKTGSVSILDYKQALLFQLMHSSYKV